VDLLKEAPTEALIYPQIVQRVLCHYLLARVPPEGLHEVCETIGEIYSHYTRLAERKLALPPVYRQSRAKHGEKYERPTFYAAEE
jgi:hypothetical protein